MRHQCVLCRPGGATRSPIRGAFLAAALGLVLLFAGSASGQTGEVWALRLTVTSGTLEDDGNLLGRLTTSLDGYDSSDLQEMDPSGFPPYLTIVFPHPEWGAHASDWYTSDYREARPNAGGTWNFEVRSNAVRQVTITWQAVLGDLSEILQRSALVNVETGETIRPQIGGSYTTTMQALNHRFIWDAGIIFTDGFEFGDLSAWSSAEGREASP